MDLVMLTRRRSSATVVQLGASPKLVRYRRLPSMPARDRPVTVSLTRPSSSFATLVELLDVLVPYLGRGAVRWSGPAPSTYSRSSWTAVDVGAYAEVGVTSEHVCMP